MPPRQIADGVFLIDTMAMGIPGLVASYLVKGDKSALVDTGYATSAPTVLSELQAVDAGNWEVDYLIPTHVHLDHGGGVGHLAKAMANARVLVSQRGARHVEDPTKLVKSVIGIYGADAISAFGTPLAVARERIEAMASVRHLDLGGGKRLRLFSTPGHAPHQMSVLLENERLLITGDAVGLRYPSFNVVIPASMPPSFDEAQWVETLNRFRRMDLAGLLLPHFGPVLQDVGGFIQKNLEATEQWGSRIRQALTENEPLSEVIEYFLADIAERTRKPRDGLPERMTRAVSLSVTGFYQHAQRKSRGQ